MNTRTISTTAALLLALTACSSGSEEAAKPSNSPKVSSTPRAEESASTDKDQAQKDYEEAQKNLQNALDDADKALGETLGVQEGTYEVTNSQPEYDDPMQALDDEYIAPGTYTTKGPADQSSGCYWARMQDASGQAGRILANDLTTGRAIVSLKDGEFFKTSGCKPWTHSGG
ncbi:hypothetical protein [Streptomyces sp. NPDC054834]